MSQSPQQIAVQGLDTVVTSKLPALTVSFWIMKIAATTLGETAGDLFSMTLHIGYLISLLGLLACFAVALVTQLRTRQFHPCLYWSVILATSTAGTEISDYMDRTLKLGYPAGTAILLITLVAVLVVWRLSTGSLSVTNVKTTKDEVFYWTAILVSNTLGTALGDFLALSSGLGFVGSNLIISALLALTLIGRYFTKFSRVTLFWIAFVLTRPFGATFGDLLTKSPTEGGLGFGTIGSSLVLGTILVACILWTHARHTDIAASST